MATPSAPLPDGVVPNLAQAMRLLSECENRLQETVYLLQQQKAEFNPAPFKRLATVLDEAHQTTAALVLRASKRN